MKKFRSRGPGCLLSKAYSPDLGCLLSKAYSPDPGCLLSKAYSPDLGCLLSKAYSPDQGCLLSKAYSPDPDWLSCEEGSFNVHPMFNGLLLVFLLKIRRSLNDCLPQICLFVLTRSSPNFKLFMLIFEKRKKHQLSNPCLHDLLHAFSHIFKLSRRVNLGGRLHEPGLAANPCQVASPGQPFSSQTPVTVYM